MLWLLYLLRNDKIIIVDSFLQIVIAIIINN